MPMTPESTPEKKVPHCKKTLALLTPEPLWEPSLCAALEEAFGPVDYRGPFFPFPPHEGGMYYEPEMGGPLHRGLLSFRGLADPSSLAAWKHAAHALEAAWSRDGKRTRNLDIGYLDPDKFVLASFKPGPRKIYVGESVWADLILGYSSGEFVPIPWTFPDFRSGVYNPSLGVIREKLKAEMRR